MQIICSVNSNGTIHYRSKMVFLGNAHKEYRRKYNIDNKEKIACQCKKYYVQNIDAIKLNGKEYYKDNKLKINVKHSQHYQTHKKQYKQRNRKNRAIRYKWGTPISINNWFKASHLHHMHIQSDHQICMYIPAELHTSIWHSHTNIKTMNAINTIAWNWYFNEAENRLDEMYDLEYETYDYDFRAGELNEMFELEPYENEIENEE